MLTTGLLIAAVVLAGVAQIEARGKSLVAWSALLGFGAFLMGRL